VLKTDGTLDRAKLRSIVFADAQKRHALEANLHPRIRAEVARQATALTAPYCVIMIPLLVESGADYALTVCWSWMRRMKQELRD
jgi:dephospho-CoA kinase